MPPRIFRLAEAALMAAWREGRHVRALVVAGEGLERFSSPSPVYIEGLSEAVMLECEGGSGPPRVVALFFERPLEGTSDG